MYIDSHAHLTSESVLPDIAALLARAKSAGLRAVVNICTDKKSLEEGIELAKHYPWIFNAAATTPHDVSKEGEELFPIMEQAARSGALVAVGETGLDYYYEHSDREMQKDFLRRYLRLAKECDLPVVIHCREAFRDFFEILDKEYTSQGKHLPGVLHCFTGTPEEARQVIDRGWYLSLSGIVTFKKSEILKEVARFVPLEQLLIETDTPYLAPQSQRGKKNEPAFLPEICLCIAHAKGIEPALVADATRKNAVNLFRLTI